MSHTQQYKAYATARQTVAKTRQIVMLYDGAIRYLQQASEAIREKRIEDRYHLLVKASEIVSGLQGCLDFEKGGQVASLLHHFYTSVDLRIFSLHRTASAEACEQIIRDLKQMRDVWHEIDGQQGSGETASGGNAPAPAAPAPGGDLSAKAAAIPAVPDQPGIAISV